jgi:hypothetical protein
MISSKKFVVASFTCIALVCVVQLAVVKVNVNSAISASFSYHCEKLDTDQKQVEKGVPWLSSTDLDRHPHPCQNSSNVGGYQLPPLSTKPYCSDLYLVFFRFGQFNNELRSFVAALTLATAINRTVVLTDDLGYNFSALINTTDLCAVEMSYEQIRNVHGTSLKPIPCVSWEGYAQKCPLTHRGLPLVNYSFDASGYRYPNDGRHNVHCIAPLLPHFPHNQWITFGSIFFTGVPKSTYMSILKRIDFLDEIKSESDKFIQEKFHSKEFVGLHVRGLDGLCERSSGGFGVYKDEYLRSCNMSWEFVSEKMRIHGYDPDTVPIYLATDNQRPNITLALLSHPNVRMWNGNNSFMMDSCLLTKSSLFIGVAKSSMSFHVALWREIHGHHMKTNILAAYQETGLLEHFFMKRPDKSI